VDFLNCNLLDLFAAARVSRMLEERARAERLRDARSRAGKASAAARRAKYGENGVAAHMRSIARSGGIERQKTITQAERLRGLSAGGRASWAKLTPEQAREKRRRAGEAAKLVISHEQRVENGKKGAAKRWPRSAV